VLGEYDGSSNLIQETVWLGDIPVGTLRPSGSSYYVHTDQLNTPRQVTRPSDNTGEKGDKRRPYSNRKRPKGWKGPWNRRGSYLPFMTNPCL